MRDSILIKDHAKLSITVGELTIRACDVDPDGYVENVDVIRGGNILCCQNIQTNDSYAVLVRELFRAFGVLESE